VRNSVTTALIILIFSIPCFAQPGKPGAVSQKETVIAIVLGKEITPEQLKPEANLIAVNRVAMDTAQFENWLESYQKYRLSGYIFGQLLEQYAKDRSLEPTDAEIQTLINISRKRETALRNDLSPGGQSDANPERL